MKKVVAFGASSSSQSINKQFAKWAADQLKDCEVTILDLNDFEMPIFSVDREKSDGIPPVAAQFKDALSTVDGIIISFAEHNGGYSAAFKNILDWFSRIERPIWMNKPMLLLATSPGARGAQGVLATAKSAFPHQGAQVIGSFSLPSFNENFEPNQGIPNTELKRDFDVQLTNFQLAL